MNSSAQRRRWKERFEALSARYGISQDADLPGATTRVSRFALLCRSGEDYIALHYCDSRARVETAAAAAVERGVVPVCYFDLEHATEPLRYDVARVHTVVAFNTVPSP